VSNPFGSVIGQLLLEADGSIPYNIPDESINLESVKGLRTELDDLAFPDIGGLVTRAQLPSEIAYEDEANSFTEANTFSKQITSTITTGTAPFSIVSTTLVTNLNADLLDGLHSSAFVLTGHTHAASEITAGTFPTGTFTFQNIVSIADLVLTGAAYSSGEALIMFDATTVVGITGTVGQVLTWTAAGPGSEFAAANAHTHIADDIQPGTFSTGGSYTFPTNVIFQSGIDITGTAVAIDATAAVQMTWQGTDTDNEAGLIIEGRAGNSGGALTATGILFRLRALGHDGVGYNAGGEIEFESVAAWNATNHDTQINFKTTSSGSAPATRWSITNTGTLIPVNATTDIATAGARMGTVFAVTVDGTSLVGAGSGITALDAGNISSGLLALARGGLNLDTSSVGQGGILRGAPGGGAWQILSLGASGRVLTSDGTSAEWSLANNHTHGAEDITSGTFATGNFTFQADLTIGGDFTGSAAIVNTWQGTDTVNEAGLIIRGRAANSGGAITSAGILLRLQGYGHDGSAYAAGAEIQFQSPVTWNGTNHDAQIDFLTTSSGSAPSVRWSITNTGTLIPVSTSTDIATTGARMGTVFATTLDGTSIVGGGAGITGLDADNISAGTLAAARGGLGLDVSGVAAGGLLHGAPSAGNWSILTLGADGFVLTVSGGDSVWVAANTHNHPASDITPGTFSSGGAYTFSTNVILQAGIDISGTAVAIDATASVQMTWRGQDDTNEAGLIIEGRTANSGGAITAAGVMLRLQGLGHDGTGYAIGGEIEFESIVTWNGTNHDTRINFKTTSTAAAPTTRFFISATGISDFRGNNVGNIATLTATSLSGTLTTASQVNITAVGTLTTGVWEATFIATAFGGTNFDSSGVTVGGLLKGAPSAGNWSLLSLGADSFVLTVSGGDAVWASASSHTHTASQITSGTFASGNFIFQANLTIGGDLSVNGGDITTTDVVTNNWQGTDTVNESGLIIEGRTANSGGALTASGILFRLQAYGHDGVGYNLGGEIEFESVATWNGSNHDTQINFKTTSTASVVTRWSITALGNLERGATAHDIGATGARIGKLWATDLDVVDDVTLGSASTDTLTVNAIGVFNSQAYSPLHDNGTQTGTFTPDWDDGNSQRIQAGATALTIAIEGSGHNLQEGGIYTLVVGGGVGAVSFTGVEWGDLGAPGSPAAADAIITTFVRMSNGFTFGFVAGEGYPDPS